MAATDIALPGTHEPTKKGPSFYDAAHGLKSWLLTLDHKRIGLMYLGSVVFAFFLGGTFAILLRLELLTPGRTYVDAKTYNQFFTLHGAIMVFLFIIPAIPAALGNFILPMQIGAKDVAFPRLNLMSFYIYLIGAFTAVYSILSGSIDTGWTFYTPYSAETDTSVVPMVAGIFIMGFSSILTGLNFIVTIHKLRAPGVTWGRLSLFLWSLYATSVIQVLATPVLAITLALLAMERVVGVGIFDPKLGGDPILFQHFFWFYSHPAVYIMILPGMGIISDLVATFTRKKIFGYKAVAMSSIGLALVSFIVWGHHLFVSGQSEFATIVFSFLTFLVAIPSAIKVINWTMTMYQGSIDLKTPMLYALSFIWMFTIGGLTGIFLGVLSIDVHLHDTYFVVAHFHYVMMGGTVMGFLGGLWYWWPKMTGKMYDEKIARISWALVFIGFNCTFFVQFIMGGRGMPRRYYNYLDQFQKFHVFSTVGSWILAAGFLTMLFCLIRSLQKGEKAPPNPWHSLAYEWQSPSPPPLENFERQPIVNHGPYDYHLAKTSIEGDSFAQSHVLYVFGFNDRAPDMSSSTAEATAHEGHGHDDHGHGPAYLAHHFDTPEQQFESAKLGMWVFLVTEILMFGGLFAAFIVYKSLHHDIFVEAHHKLSKVLGGTNTVVLLTSSWTVALAVRASQLGKKSQATMLLGATIACALIFLVIKYFEYSAKIEHGYLPGPYFHAHDLPHEAHVFFSLYFLMTGLHGFHVCIGVGLITWVMIRNIKGEFSSAFYTPIDIVGLYWHLVDLIWIYLFPLLYLIG